MKRSFALFKTVTVVATGCLGYVCGTTTGFADSVAQSPTAPPAAVAPVETTETLVLFRHGEKTAQEYGQLSPMGLNRSLALPEVLLGKYGKPNFLFAPNPSKLIHSRTDSENYSYVRPLATIEPTAIKLGMPVNTQYGFTEIDGLEKELAKSTYANAVVFIAWEHGYLDKFAKAVVKDNGGSDAVPEWPGKDYDSIFVIRLHRSGDKTTATFTVDHEGLDGKLSDKLPLPAGN